MIRYSRWWRLPQRDPFKVLGLSRAATKAEVKMKYRELARVYHPDAESGDGVKMEEVNHAYKLLLKEGGYERLHLPGPKDGVSSTANGAVGVTAEGRRHPPRQTAAAPFSVDQQEFSTEPSGTSASSSSYLSDEEMEKVSALDPATERRTPEGKYLYQSRDDQSWVEMDRPLLRAHQPHYASFAAQADMKAELRRRAVLKEREQNEKSGFQRAADRLADSADLPTRNRHLLRFYALLVITVFYLMFKRTFERTTRQQRRTGYYHDLEENRAELLEAYALHKAGLQVSAVAAAVVFIAAAEHKTMLDAVVPSPPEVFFRAVRPPPDHFTVVAGG
ncbi:putative mitochondrial DnaJ domain protein-like protein [Leptomonas pyrrhocoris]|uniref:Putative mitochondrial DnaJ domain protein-like protein n=1 Tax=Leptomonas pyrrhocoris TaxID=157538 RepID=A0A0M9G6J7_LEPPY|nr:putative mitochondrial DnaJ domain protein-like protein [Leptomonas pyrrhocoris]KPA83309.1 putative mitochondrial DnaJ domain protein-like protein [Leptomonas pyrrhocoris]|eukprot:XP_015661748.1 putative mitochondrial DnaJ domain protein-like protein [Leptomonas pyrrhocoris]